ncbi:ankyrin repeat domain-containing protein [Wolbachia endosymbiont (group A) of Opomyza germinationis]|uniref:ankyrin repeat domain-containing protein n=1 Tax=Wolbachia endosymbiont (group A) of Opomyza germinationis TaxID=3077917 RepID=UPI0035C92BC0
MLKIDYLKKGKSSSETLEGAQHVKQITSQREALHFEGSDDNPELPENLKIGLATTNGDCFFDSFRQGLEQQLGIQVNVEQLRCYCRDFARNNPPEWFINAIANSHDNSGRVRTETLDSYASVIVNSNRWGDPEVEGRILCEKYQVKLHVIEKLSYLLHLQQRVLDGERGFGKNINSIIMDFNSDETFASKLQNDQSKEASGLLEGMKPFHGLDNIHQLISSSGSFSISSDSVDYDDQYTIHIINRGNNHFEPVLGRKEIQYLRSDDGKESTKQEYSKGGLTNSLHGIIYQLRLLMLFLKQGLDKKYVFRLATEMDIAEKFDDLVFERKNEKKDGSVFRFLQAKHKQDGSKEITVNDLLAEKNGPFSLKKYFISYRKIKEKLEFNGKNRELEDFVICTNADFNENLQDSFELMKGEDDILDIQEGNNGRAKRLKFKGGTSLEKESLVSLLKDASDLKELGQELAAYVFKSGTTNSDKVMDLRNCVFKKYHRALAKEVIDIKGKKFSTCFVNNDNLSEEASKLRRILLKESNLLEDEFKKELQGGDLKISLNFGKMFRIEENLQILKKGSRDPVQELAQKFADSISSGETIVLRRQSEIIKGNIDKLAGHVLIEQDGKVKFREGFLDYGKEDKGNALSKSLKDFRDKLEKALLEKRIPFSFLKQCQLKISDFETCGEEDYEEYRKDKYYFQKTEQVLPNDEVKNEEIDEFLEKLVFAVGQPNEVEIGKILEKKISEEFSRKFDYIGELGIDAYNKLQIQILNWMKDKEGRFLSDIDIKSFFREFESRVSTLSSMQQELKTLDKGVGRIEDKLEVIHSDMKAQQNNKQTYRSVLFDVEQPMKLFTGRKNVIDALHKGINYSSGKLAAAGGALITGLGGVGKSELAREYARLCYSYYDGNIVWINAESEATLVESFNRLARDKLGITTKDGDGGSRSKKSIIEDVYKFFDGRRSLFIFDNAEKDKSFGKFLPSSFSMHAVNKPYVLITSRDRELLQDIELLELPAFDLEEAKLFIQDSLGIEDGEQKENIRKLSEILGFLPLALRQAVTYIKEANKLGNARKRFSIDDYLKIYEEKKQELLDFKFLEDSDNLYTRTTLTTWEITIDKIFQDEKCGQQAKELLEIIAYFFPDRIPVKMLLELIDGDEEEVSYAIRLVERYSMVSMVEGELFLKIHRLVQEVTRLKLTKEAREAGVLKKVLASIKSEMDEDSITQVASIWKYASKYDDLINNFYFNSRYGSYYDTPLDLLIQDCEEQAVDNILKSIKTNHRDKLLEVVNTNADSNHAPVFLAVEVGSLRILDLLIESGANFGGFYKSIGNLLHSAVSHGQLDIIQYLADKKVFDLNSVNEGGMASLHLAAFNGYSDVVEYLIKKGAKVNLKDRNGYTPLHWAASNDHLKIVEYLIKKGAKVNLKDRNGYTPLHWAASNDNLKIVEYLIKKGAKVNLKDRNGYTPLHWAAFNGYSDVVEYLIKKGAKVNLKDRNGYTPLHWAASNDNLKIVEYLVEKGAEVNLKDRNSYTPLHWAASNDHLKIVEYLIKKGAEVNLKDRNSYTPLHWAASNDHLKIVEYLVEKGAEVNLADLAGYTPLHWAAFNGHSDVVEYLVEKGAEVNLADLAGYTPLHWAAFNGYSDVVEYLVEKGAEVNLAERNGYTPLHWAAFYGHSDVVEYLVEKGAEVNLAERNGYTPLHWAAFYGHSDVVEYLIKKGAEVNLADLAGYTPLHWAAFYGYSDVVEYLIKKGAKVNLKDRNGYTPLHWAASNDHLKIVEYLIKKGAEVNLKDRNSYTPLHWAASNDHLKIVEYLVEKGAEVNLADLAGYTPLHWAAFNGHSDVVEYLVEKGAEVNLADLAGYTPLHWAAFYGYSDVVEYLIKKGAEVNLADLAGYTPLHWAAFYGYSDVVEYLIKKGAKVNLKDRNGYTPLHCAASNDHLKIVEYLIKKGAEVNLADLAGYTPLHWAAFNGHSDVVEYLVEKGAEVNLADLAGYTPLHWAAFNGHSDVVEYLVEKGADPSIFSEAGELPIRLAIAHRNFNVEQYLKNKKSRLNHEGSKRTLEECLPGRSHRSKREAESECLFTWEDVDEFNVERGEKRDFNKINIDSEKFVNYIKDLPEEKRSQLIHLADEARVKGRSQGLVNRLISNQKIMSHLAVVGRISGIAMHGMMAKNVLADFLNGNYQGVAINVGFIAGGQGFAKVAEATSLKGLKLASEGKLLLGSSLRAASPFLSRGTSAFVIYDLVNQVKAFKNGTEEALVGIVGDSIYLGVDAAEIGIEVAEAFEVLEGVSSVTGPIGAAIGAVVFVGTDIYMAVKRVDEIDQIIHLKGNEKFIEGLRAFIDMQPEQYIEELIEKKQVNNQLVNQGLEYLKQHSDIQGYVFPTGELVIDSDQEVSHKLQMDLDNLALLGNTVDHVIWHRAKPDNPNVGKLFCLPTGPIRPEVGGENAYLCHNAIGLFYLADRTGNSTLIALGKGRDRATGFRDSPNIFLVDDGNKELTGGDKDDVFILVGNKTIGTLDGGDGNNTLNLAGFALDKDYISVNFNLFKHYGLISSSSNDIRIKNMNIIYGRKGKQDIVDCGCYVRYIDGQGGLSNNSPDNITIPYCHRPSEKKIIVRPSTEINNLYQSRHGIFDYIIPSDKGKANINIEHDYTFAQQKKHNFLFNYTIFNLVSVDTENIKDISYRYAGYGKMTHTIKNVTFSFLSPSLKGESTNEKFNITISDIPANASYILGNGAEIKIGNRGNFYMLENTNKSVDEIIKEYLVVANRLNKMSFFIQSLLSSETVAIGSGNHEVIHNNPLHKSHLVGNGGENIYVVDSETDNVPEVIIYDVDEENSIDTIDLRNVVKKAKDNFELQVIESENDLLLRATAEKHEYFTVRLKDGVERYNKTHVIVENVPMRISVDKNEWCLKPQPLIFEKDKEVIVITDQDVEKDTELIIPRKGGNYTFVRSNSNDLMITNAFDFSITQNGLCSITLSRFYETPKMATLSIKFADKEVVLKDHQEEISTARDVNVVKKEHKDQVYNDVFNKKRSPEVTLSDQPKLMHKHRHEHSRKQIRHRRHHRNEQNLSHAVGELGNQANIAVSSSTEKLSSRINDLFGWIKSSIGGLFNSKAVLPEETLNTTSSISQIDAPIDVNGTIMLLDLLIRKVTVQKYISLVESPISLLEAQGYALNITNRFEKVVEQAGLKSGVSMHRLNIDYVGMQKEITRKVMSGKFNEISGILSSYVEKAFPGRGAGKLSPKKFDQFIAQFNKGLLNQSIEQILHNRDGTLEVDDAKQMSLEPQSYLSNASVHSHSKVSTCLSEMGVTKLGGNLNR